MRIKRAIVASLIIFPVCNSFASAEVMLDDFIKRLNFEEAPVFITGCRAVNDKYIEDGLFPILIAETKTPVETIFLLDEKKDSASLGGAEWGSEYAKGWIFEAQGGVWSYKFAFEIYTHLRTLPFTWRTEITKEDLIEIASQRVCQIDHTSLDEYVGK